MENLTIVVPFYNGQRYLEGLLSSLPDNIPVIFVDDLSDQVLEIPEKHHRPNIRTIRLEEKGYFSGAVNVGIEACSTDVLVLNQDVKFSSTHWLRLIENNRKNYAFIGERIKGEHPAFPDVGYIHGVFMFMRRDVIEKVGLLDAEFYPLWGSTAIWQWKVSRAGYEVLPLPEVPGMVHQRDGNFGSSIQQLLRNNPQQRDKFIRTPPEISVIIPCYNHGIYLRDAVNSLIGGETSLGVVEPQTFQSFEIIIVNDGSTDDSEKYALELASKTKGIKYIRRPNGGTAAAHNTGVRHALGKYVTFMSADDMREPNALEILYRACLENPHSFVYDELIKFWNGRKHGNYFGNRGLAPYDFETLLHRNMVPVGIMLEKKAVEEVGGYPESLKYGREDWGFAIALGINGYCGIKLDNPGYLYRREGQNRTLTNTDGNWKQFFTTQMKELFPNIYNGERPMGCCGSSNKQGQVMNNPKVQRFNALRDVGSSGMVFLEYVGANLGSQQWGGPNVTTKQVYVFGNNDRDRIKLVDARDAKWFLQLTDKSGSLLFRQVSEKELAERSQGEIVEEEVVYSDETEDSSEKLEELEKTEETEKQESPDAFSAEKELFDPSEHVISEVKNHVEDSDFEEIQRVLEVERKNKNRATLIDYLETLLLDVEDND